MTLNDLLEEFNVVIDTAEGLSELRSLILGLAVRGKLVPQDPNDKSAHSFLSLIADKKQRLLKKKKIKNAKILKEHELPDIKFKKPPGWEICQLHNLIIDASNDIVDGPFGSRLKANEYVDSGVPLIRIQNIDRDLFINKKIQFISEQKANELERHNYIPGDIVLNKLGDPAGKTCIVPNEVMAGIIVADIVRIRVDKKSICDRFIVHCFNSDIVQEQFSFYSKGVTRQRVNLSQVRSLLFMLPPLEEQHRIVTRIESLFAEVDELEAQLEQQTKLDKKLQLATNAEVQQAPDAETSKAAWNIITSSFDTLYHTPESIDNLKKNILNEAVRGRLVPQDPNDEPASELLKKIEAEKQRLYEEGVIRKPTKLPPVTEEEIPFEIPKSWEWCRLGDSTTKITDGTHHSPTNTETGDFLYITAKNIKNDGVLLSNATYVTKEVHNEIYSRCNPEFGDILYIKDGATTGITTLNDIYEPFSMLSSVALIKTSGIIYNPFLINFFRSGFYYSQMRDQMTGAAITRVTLKKLNNAVLALPPIEEQHRIVRRIEELFAICDEFKAKLEQREKVIDRLVKGLVQEVLEGV